MVSSLVKKACAISAVLNPHSVFKINATCPSSATEGWQHTNIMRSCSSSICCGDTISCSVPVAVYSDLSRLLISLANPLLYFSLRTTSSALFRATVKSQAEGSLGMPWNFQFSKALSRESCTTSSANCTGCAAQIPW